MRAGFGVVCGHRGVHHLSERVVEPPGHRGPAEADAADGSWVAAQPEPACARDQLGTGEADGLGAAHQVGGQLGGGSSVGLRAHGERQ